MSFLQYMKLPSFRKATIETVDVDPTSLLSNEDMVCSPNDNVPSPCASPKKAKKKRKKVVDKGSSPESYLAAEKRGNKLVISRRSTRQGEKVTSSNFTLVDETDVVTPVLGQSDHIMHDGAGEDMSHPPGATGLQQGDSVTNQELLDFCDQEFGSLSGGIFDLDPLIRITASHIDLPGTSNKPLFDFDFGESVDRFGDDELVLPLILNKGDDGIGSSIELDPDAAKETFVPSFKNVKNGSTYDDPKVCRELIDFMPTPAERIRSAKKLNNTVSDDCYLGFSQLAVGFSEMRQRWTRSIREANKLADMVGDLRVKDQASEARIMELEQQVADLHKDKELLNKEKSSLEKKVEDLETNLAAEKKLLGQSILDLEAHKNQVESKTRRLENVVKSMEKKNNSLLSDKEWLIHEGYTLAFEKFRRSFEFLSSFANVQTKSFMAGYQQGLSTCEDFVKQGLPISKVPDYDSNAYSKFEESAKHFDTLVYPFWKKFAQASDLSLDYVKSIEPDLESGADKTNGDGVVVFEPGLCGEGKSVVGGSDGPSSIDPKAGGTS